MDKIVNSR